MTYNKYIFYSSLLCGLIILDINILKPLGMSRFFQTHAILLDVMYFLPFIMALIFMILSVLAFIKKIEPLKKVGRPITICMITFSFIMVVASMSIIYKRYSTINKIISIRNELEIKKNGE